MYRSAYRASGELDDSATIAAGADDSGGEDAADDPDKSSAAIGSGISEAKSVEEFSVLASTDESVASPWNSGWSIRRTLGN